MNFSFVLYCLSCIQTRICPLHRLNLFARRTSTQSNPFIAANQDTGRYNPDKIAAILSQHSNYLVGTYLVL